jgi:large subunit ribosomal protein L24e
MIVDQNLLLAGFQKRRNVPVKYDRNLVAATMKAMERIEEIRVKRERVFARRRLRGKAQREKKRLEDLKTVAQGEHLIRKEMQELKAAREEGREEMVQEVEPSRVVGEERLRMRSKRKMLVDGGIEEEMDVD